MAIFKKLNIGDTVASSGTRCFKKLTTDEPLQAGLYDANDNLVASWKTLVNDYKWSLSGSYYYYDQLKKTSGPYYILNTYSELSTGEKLIIDDSVTRIGDYAFYRCASLKEVIIPESVTSLGHYSFASCTGLVKVIIPGSVQTVSDGMFRDCTSLKDVTIGEGFRYLRDYMFDTCSSLPSIILPESVTTIGKCALANCERLKDVTIPVSLKTIRLAAFGGAGLNDVYYRGTQDQWAGIEIAENNEELLNATIHYNYTD